MLFEQPFSQVPPQPIAASPVRYLRIAPKKHIRTVVGPPISSVKDDLAQARVAWKRYQSTRRRDAIYDYLRAVFKIMRRWRKEHRVKASSHQALKATGHRITIRNHEPFAAVIFCTSAAHTVDAKTRSKWSRALRYAERFKPDTQSLAQFIKSKGGINECACLVVRSRSRNGENTLKRSSGAQFRVAPPGLRRHDGQMRPRSTTPDSFSVVSGPSFSPANPASDPSAAAQATAAASNARHILPGDFPHSIKHLSDHDFNRLLSAVLAEQKRRGKTFTGSKTTSQKRPVNTVRSALTAGKANAIRAAFKAGVRPSQIARTFGISQTDVRRALGSNAAKR